MCLQTFFDVLPNILLVLPTVSASDLMSRSDKLEVERERGSDTPSTCLLRMRFLNANPPARPAAASPAATAGRFALLAAPWIVPATPRSFRLDSLRLELPLGRGEPLGADEALRRRADAADFDRADFEVPEELEGLPPDREDPLALVFDAEVLDALFLLCPPRALDLLLAIPDFLFQLEKMPLQPLTLPNRWRHNTMCRGSQSEELQVRRSQPKQKA